MSTETSSERHNTRKAITPSTATSPTSTRTPRNSHHLTHQAQMLNKNPEMNPQSQPTTPPRTPRRAHQQNKTSSAAPEPGLIPKSRQKNRQKNPTISPVATKTDRKTPPLPAGSTAASSSSRPIATPSTAAYAGATFHASPAPSALPIPSFYSKSVPDSPGTKSLTQVRELSLPTASESPTPPALTGNGRLQREESPLDLFFKADREEKARARSASSTQNAVTASGPFHPPTSPRSSQTPPAFSTTSRARYSHSKRSSSSGMFAFELDGPQKSPSPFGPAFSTPYAERISAARRGNKIDHPPPAQSSPHISLDRSEALKQYLFSDREPSAGVDTSLEANSTPRAQFQSNSFGHDMKPVEYRPKTAGRTSGLRQEVIPSKTTTQPSDLNAPHSGSPTPSRILRNTLPPDTNQLNDNSTLSTTSPFPPQSNVVSQGNKSAEIKGMEDSLRKILKLDSAQNSDATSSGMGSMPKAAVSVPNYVGSRTAPMNGIHNGVMGS